MSELSDLSDWDLRDMLRNPLGTASALSPSVELTEGVHEGEAKATQEAARAEFRERGYSDEEMATIEAGDDSPIRSRPYRD